MSKRPGDINRLASLVVDIATGQVTNDSTLQVGHAKGGIARAEACRTVDGRPL